MWSGVETLINERLIDLLQMCVCVHVHQNNETRKHAVVSLDAYAFTHKFNSSQGLMLFQLNSGSVLFKPWQ